MRVSRPASTAAFLSRDLFGLELRGVVLFELFVRLHEVFGTLANPAQKGALGQLHHVLQLHGAAILRDALLECGDVLRHELAEPVFAWDERVSGNALAAVGGRMGASECTLLGSLCTTPTDARATRT